MNEHAIRPTKKQRELLSYIEGFIQEHGYSPSYREIMNGLSYTSVATVSLHVNSLIRRGHLRKRDRSARSLEVVRASSVAPVVVQAHPTEAPAEENWLIERVEQFFADLEAAALVSARALEDLRVLVGSLRVLGFEEVAVQYDPRIDALTNRVDQ